MKRLILILLILLISTANAFSANVLTNDIPNVSFDETLEDSIDLPADIPTDVTENTLTGVSKNNGTINIPVDTTKNIPDNTKKDTLSDKVSQINLLPDDEQKIKEWVKLNSAENYIIINKKDCLATIYDNNGNEIKSFEIGVGRDKGDDFNDTSGLVGKSKNTTPAGEFTLQTNIFNKAAYGDLTLSLGKEANKSQKSKKVVALHKIPKFRMEDRFKKFYDGDLANNRMSHGCINFVEKDFKELTKYIHGGLKAYILPEEVDNHLTLEKNNKGDFEFVQTKY